MFLAEKGNGAFLNNSRIRVSNKKKISDSLIVTGGPKYVSNIKDKIFSEYINVSKKVLSLPMNHKYSSYIIEKFCDIIEKLRKANYQ